MKIKRLIPRPAALLATALVWLMIHDSSQAQVRGTTRSTPTRSTGSAAASRSTTGGARDYLNSTMVGEATIASDPETRRIIVITDDETSQYVTQVIENLDKPAPQVLIKVIFVEMTRSEAMDLGVEGSYTKDLGSGNTLNIAQDFGLAALGGNPTPPAINNYGAGIYQIVGDGFTVTLRAIAEDGRAKILSRPSILTRNGQQAVITVGQEVPLITNTRFDTFGNQINTVTYQDVGIILRVTPFITTDGLVEMIVAPQISDLADRSQWIPIDSSGGVAAPTINTRSADTVVVTPHGQTVIMGGLMQTVEAKSQSKVPFLGDIPGLGFLFRRTLTKDQNTELLIFLTPYIVETPTALAGLTTTERQRSPAANKSLSEEEVHQFLEGLPEKAAPTTEKPKDTK